MYLLDPINPHVNFFFKEIYHIYNTNNLFWIIDHSNTRTPCGVHYIGIGDSAKPISLVVVSMDVEKDGNNLVNSFMRVIN